MHSIAIVLTARFPSEKAYSVTISETAKAANLMSIAVEIYAPFHSDIEPAENVIYFDSKLIRKLSSILGKLPKIVDIYFFFIRRILIAIKFRKKLGQINRPNLIVWTRDPLIAIMTNRRTKVFLELHNTPSYFDSVLCKFLNGRPKLSVGTLTSAHRDNIRKYFSKTIIVILPMAVSNKFFLLNQKRISTETIGYIGKGWSSGEDNKLTNLIDSAKLIDRQIQTEIQWNFLGLEPTYKSKMEILIKNHHWLKSRFNFINHVSHDLVPDYLSTMSFGLIPYLDSPYNRQRFPIKALEYAAAGVTILATNTPGNRSVLDVDRCYFYDPQIKESLAKVINLVLNEDKERNQKREKALRWARAFTYESRVSIVLDSFDGLTEGIFEN